MAIRTLDFDGPPTHSNGGPGHPAHEESLEELIRSGPVTVLLAILVDVISAGGAALLAMKWEPGTQQGTPSFWLMILYAPIVIAIFGLRSMYRRKLNNNLLNEFGAIQTSVAFGRNVPARHLGRRRPEGFPRPSGLQGVVLRGSANPGGTAGPRHHITNPQAPPSFSRAHILVVGNGRIASRIVERLQASPEYGLNPVGLIDATPPWSGPDSSRRSRSPTSAHRIPSRTSSSKPAPRALSSPSRSPRTNCSRSWSAKPIGTGCAFGWYPVCSMWWANGPGGAHRRTSAAGLPTPTLGWQFTLKHITDRIAAAVGLLISPMFLTLALLVKLRLAGTDLLQPTACGPRRKKPSAASSSAPCGRYANLTPNSS